MNVETIARSPSHFAEYHTENGEKICMQFDGRCSVAVEISGSEEEQRFLANSVENALQRLDTFFDGRFAELFQGLRIKIGDNLCIGGGEAISGQNLIVLDKKKNLMSLVEAEKYLVSEGIIDAEDAEKLLCREEAERPGSTLVVGLVHEFGHILDETTDGPKRHRISASESPTKYGREPDQWHDVKDHEAFAEGFTHMVFGADVSYKMREAVLKTVEVRVAGKNWGEL